MKMGVAFGGQIQDALNAHMATFRECRPRQMGGTLRVGGE
jgi:arylsulfatase